MSSHFQHHVTFPPPLQFAQLADFDPRTAQLFKQLQNPTKLDFREIILLDSQLTMDLFFNPKHVSDIHESDTTIKLKSNGGEMRVHHQAKVAGYHTEMWFKEKAINNIVSLENLINNTGLPMISGIKPLQCILRGRESSTCIL